MATTDQDGFFVAQQTDTIRPFASYLNAIIANLKARIKDQTPTGTVVAYAGATAPDGWYLCDGSIRSKNNDPKLFAVIGTTYGQGNGGTGSFNLPNLSGRFPVGSKMNASENLIYNYARGTASGAEQVTLTVPQMPRHSHRQEYGYAPRGIPIKGGPVKARTAHTIAQNGYGFKRYNNQGLYVYDSGESKPHTNTPRYLALNYIIKR